MINTVGTYLVSRAFLAGMIDAGWGRIINVSSAASLGTPGPLTSAYATSKVAQNHFTRHLAAELAGTGVTANVIHPGVPRNLSFRAFAQRFFATALSAERSAGCRQDVKTEMWEDIVSARTLPLLCGLAKAGRTSLSLCLSVHLPVILPVCWAACYLPVGLARCVWLSPCVCLSSGVRAAAARQDGGCGGRHAGLGGAGGGDGRRPAGEGRQACA